MRFRSQRHGVKLALLIALVLGIVGCGGSTDVAEKVALSPSPAVSPSLPSAKQLVSRYLTEVKWIRREFYAWDAKVHPYVTTKGVSASDEVRKDHAGQIDGWVARMRDLQEAYARIDPPEAMKKVHPLFAKYMDYVTQGDHWSAESLRASTANWELANQRMAKADMLWAKSYSYQDRWAAACRAVAEEVGARVPWKWVEWKWIE
jgi:hypothetical protein